MLTLIAVYRGTGPDDAKLIDLSFDSGVVPATTDALAALRAPVEGSQTVYALNEKRGYFRTRRCVRKTSK